MLAEALEHLVRGIVDNPDDVQVKSRGTRRGELLEIRVNPDDLGRVIGRGGRTAKALRTVTSALSSKGSVRIDVVETDED
ncbi:MAG: RNA-binding protein [Actinomycetaceae bacterium]|nr:RNA-binding protein [Actinomycetaceae bacterium]